MSPWSLDTLARALGAHLIGARPAGRAPLGKIGTDTRSLEPRDVFVALRGEQFDGHAFLGQAVERGASCLVVSDARAAVGLGVPVLLVKDTLTALGALATAWRRTWGGVVVAVAGSNGKTSTKDLLAGALGSVYRVHATRGNLNNHIGVPLTLLAVPGDTQVAIVEVGTNHPGEVAALRDLVEPDIAVITSVGEEHLEGLGSVEAVLREEVSIARGVPLAVTPASQPEIGAAARGSGLAQHVVDAGLDMGAVRPAAWGLLPTARGWFAVGEERVELQLVGAHNLRNAILALAVARACAVPDAAALRGLGAVRMPSMRSTLEPVGGLLVLNDAYNANPASAREALATFEVAAGDRPRAIVLGSMLELGTQSDGLHDEIARRAIATRAQVIAGIGLFADALARVAPGDPRVVSAADADGVWPLLKERLSHDAAVLLKGSRGTRLERLMPHLQSFAGVTTGSPLAAH